MKKHLILSFFCVLLIHSALAQEGMWMLNQLEQLDLAKKGLNIPIEDIYNPNKPCLANAILQLGGGSASFVSPEGLVVTNHHVAFLNQCDITGGNSGSPVMNAKGEIIGVAFDGNYEAMISDWQYDYDLQRCIAVDIRYVMFITEKFGNAGFLLDEMGVKR